MNMIKKRGVSVHGKKTSVTLEDEFWHVVILLTKSRRKTVGALIEEAAEMYPESNLSSAVRLWLLKTIASRQIASLEDRVAREIMEKAEASG